MTMQTETKTPALLTTREAAQYLRVSERTVTALWKRRAFRKTKVARATRWKRSELDAYLDRQTRGPRR
jgi:excisionase family DNA binding protein